MFPLNSDPPRELLQPGTVCLIGAGPGDPGLLTLRGAILLEQADVVVYDYLASAQLLKYCPAAEQIYVGKKAGQHAMPQQEIEKLLVDRARLGKRVVRLKGGDPFVFGRGGEECQSLVAANIPFQVVPGITAAIAGPAYAGIPVTHRDFNSSFTIVTGHEKEEESSDIPWEALAKLPCLAFYMGVRALPTICARLIEFGMPPNTPAAAIQWGTTPRQRTIVSTLAQLPAAAVAAALESPAITLIGKNVSLRQSLAWFESRPLFGQTMVVTRAATQAGELSARLTALGADVIEAPTIELHPLTDWTAIDAALDSAGDFDWIVFTSATAVQAVRQRLMETGRDARKLGNARIAVIGSATAQSVRKEFCRQVDVCPDRYVAEALADALTADGAAAGKKYLLLRADIARPVLPDRLQAAGGIVSDVAVYETKPARQLPAGLLDALRDGRIHWITFASSSCASHLIALLGSEAPSILSRTKLASIGPITTHTLTTAGLTPAVEANPHTLDGLVSALVQQGDKRPI